MNLTDAINPPYEPCLDPASELQLVSPWPVVEPHSESRLIKSLRDAADTQNSNKILIRAAILLYPVILYRSNHPQEPFYQPLDYWMSMALADLAVTGRMAYTNFQNEKINDSTLLAATSAGLVANGVMDANPAHVTEAVATVLDRAYEVAWALRGPAAWRVAHRKSLGWIAVSGENDRPHRPVNVALPKFEQFDITVTARGVTVQTRFLIASTVEDSASAGIILPTRTLPPDPLPRIPPGHQVILFLHGHSSSAEEAFTIIPHIHQIGLDRGVKYSIISFDLPNNGYSQSFDHMIHWPSGNTSYPRGIIGDKTPIRTPVLDYIEDFVVEFINALDAVTSVKNRFAGIIGGSLGGNLGLRLGRRNLTADPWLKAGIVSWSPASVWKPMVEDLVKREGPDHCRKKWAESENPDSRTDYFYEVYDKKISTLFLPRTQPELWYRDGWEPCKTFHIRESRIARQETYDANFRRWHWRVAGEQLIYSHVDRVDHHDDKTPWRYELNRVRQLLIAGDKDNEKGNLNFAAFSNIYDNTRDMCKNMGQTPGLSLFLKDTGHSIHVERPHFLAGEIVSFLFKELNKTDISFLTPLLLSDPVIKNVDISFLVPLLLNDPVIKNADISFLTPLLLSDPTPKNSDISFLVPLLLSDPVFKSVDISFFTPLLLGDPIPKSSDISFLVPLLLSDPALKSADISFLTPLL